MGFFDAIKDGAKKLADRVTGGYGKIEFSIDKDVLKPGEQISFTMQVTATGELKAKRVLVNIDGTENVRVETEVKKPDGTTEREWKTFTEIRHHEFEVHGPLDMKEGQSQTITGTVSIPSDCQPTFQGKYTQHQWTVEADVDVPMGKDLKVIKNITVR